MHLLYLDAAGTPDRSDHSKSYVLLGVCISEAEWNSFDRRLANLKSQYEYKGQELELHAKDFCCSIYGQSQITDFESLPLRERRSQVRKHQEERIERASGVKRQRLKRELRAQEPFFHLTRRERTQLYEAALDVIGDQQGLTLFAEVFDKFHPRVDSGEADPVAGSLLQVLTRFDFYLKRLNRENPGQREHGLLIFDNESDRESLLDRLFKSYRNQHPWGQLQFVIESPFFVDSARSNGVQAADICAYALRRYIDGNSSPGSHEENNLQRIWDQFDNASGKLHGLRHFVEAASCSCVICHARGHGPSPDSE